MPGIHPVFGKNSRWFVFLVVLVAGAFGALLLAGAAEVSPSPWRVLVVGGQSEPERLATVDLQRYLGEVTGVVPTVMDVKSWQAHPEPAVILGTAADNPLLAGAEETRHDLGDQGYCLAKATMDGVPVVVAGGQGTEGAVNAVYGLLRELGYGFFLGSEAVPASLPATLPSEQPVVRKPAFTIRGVLPWYNFFDSPTTWDPVDHRAFVDQLIRGGANFVGFHTYDAEPFAAYEENGRMVEGQRLHSTKTSTWGSVPMKSQDFAYGTGQLFADDYFGAATTKIADDNAAIKAEQEVLRDALDYARRRGLHACLGFEISDDPTDPKTAAVDLKRINHLLDEYPALDYVWIWQAEGQGVAGFGGPATPALTAYSAFRQDVFKRIIDRTTGDGIDIGPQGQEARQLEGARLEQAAQLIRRALEHRKNPPTLVISGWGGDHRALSAEYDEGLDKLLPRDVAFSSLDHIVPLPHVDAIYSELPKDRQRWPIPWLEADGDQWHPQPAVHTFEGAANNAWHGGAQGMLGIHWRTRDIEENLAYLVDFAWQPGLTAEEFYAQLAGRAFPAALAPEMASILSRLDSLGYRWVGGGGQTECGPYRFDLGANDTLRPGTEENTQALAALRAQAGALLPRAGPGTERLKWLLARMDWVLEYQKAEVAALDALELYDHDKPAEAIATLDAGDFGRAVRTYATRVSTRGEYGVLATINTKAVAAWRDFRNKCRKVQGKAPEPLPASEWNPEPQIILPRLIGSAPEGRDLELMPIAMGGKPAWMHYRTIGAASWKTMPIENARGWVRRAVIPAAELAGPGVELSFSFDASPTAQPAWGPHAITVMPPTPIDTTPRATVAPAAVPALGLQCDTSGRFPFVLSWNTPPAADYFKVYRDGQLLAQTAVAVYPDLPAVPAPDHTYKVEAWRDGAILTQGTLEVRSSDTPITEAPDLTVEWRKGGAVLDWPIPHSLQAAQYKVVRNGGPVATVPAMAVGMYQVALPMEKGQWTYRVIPVNQQGHEGAAASAEVEWPNEHVQTVAEEGLLGKARRIGEVQRSGDEAVFKGGYLELPFQPAANYSGGMTVSFEFNADNLENEPILIDNGRVDFHREGWAIQIRNHRLLVETMGKDMTAPGIQTGKWYAVRWDYDGVAQSLTVNGKVVAPAAPQFLTLRPNREQPIFLGQYFAPQPQSLFHGAIRNLKITGYTQKQPPTK